jgi:nucleoside-diphosphate-sugar epimerase
MRALVCGGGGFIGNHLVNFLKQRNYWVRAVDIKYPEYNHSEADEFIATDLRDPISVRKVLIAPLMWFISWQLIWVVLVTSSLESMMQM